MEKEKLDIIYDFGKDVVVKAREQSLYFLFLMIENKAKALSSKKLGKLIEKNFNEEQKKILQMLVVDSVDSTINNFIWMMEENNDKYAFTAKTKNGEMFDMEQESDGLCMGQWEFIDEFSKYNDIDKILETGEIEKDKKE